MCQIIQKQPKGDIMETILKDLASQSGILISETQMNQLEEYKKLLLEWNQKINLTAITDEEEIALKHFLDSMTILKYLTPNASMIDVGTGAGFPGLVVKIMREDLSVTLLDSLNKRISFLNEVIFKNQLKNIQSIHGRAEEFGNLLQYREHFDFAVARAVAPLPVLAEYCLPFVKTGGLFIAMKGKQTEEIELGLKAIEVLGGFIEKIDTFTLPHSEMERNLILIRKIKATPKSYPRKAGIPEKNPIV